MSGLEQAVRDSSLEPALLELVRMRTSQLNGCAFCLDMHSKDGVARRGERPSNRVASYGMT
jgi:AhpD family alkylhydroperoxidase